MGSFDKGPPDEFAEHFARLPAIAEEFRQFFWYDWGPVFYRGRLTGNPRFLGIASDPGPTERVVGRTLVGDAGQRVQGFLDKLGLTHSYVLVNAFPVALHPGSFFEGKAVLSDKDQLAWRNRFYDMVTGTNLQAIVAFGGNAIDALELWPGKPDVMTREVPHPSNPDEPALLARWQTVISELRGVVTPDDDGDAGGPNYGTTFRESDYRRIPPGDLPFGLPPWIGDDAWGRRATPRHNNCVRRAGDDADHTLVFQAPRLEVRPEDTTSPGLASAHEAEYGKRSVGYDRAFALAIPAVVHQEGSESPRQVVRQNAEAQGHPLSNDVLDDTMRDLVADGSFELLPVDETNENGDDPRKNWIFQVRVDTGSDHGFWAAVDRDSGQANVTGFN